MPWFPRRNFSPWPETASNLPTADIIQLYENGFAGCQANPEALEAFRAFCQNPNGEMVAQEYGFDDTGAGKLVVPFVHVLEMFPGCWPGKQGQGRGSCVAWNTRNAGLLTLVCDVLTGKPDEETGHIEGPPEVPAAGIADGVLSTDAIYWYRGYDGDGWYCPGAAQIACTKGGLVIRQNYAELGFDLTVYNSRTEGLYGRRSPPANVQTMTSTYLARDATELSTFEALRDHLYNGHGISTCGGEGYSDTRDECGVSRRRGSWAHAMAYIAVDDRQIIKTRYNEPLVLILNSWANWNSGPRDIYQSAELVPAHKKEKWTQLGIVNPTTGNIMIPEGSMWVRWSECRNREVISFSGVRGWKAKPIPLDFSPF